VIHLKNVTYEMLSFIVRQLGTNLVALTTDSTY